MRHRCSKRPSVKNAVFDLDDFAGIRGRSAGHRRHRAPRPCRAAAAQAEIDDNRRASNPAPRTGDGRNSPKVQRCDIPAARAAIGRRAEAARRVEVAVIGTEIVARSAHGRCRCLARAAIVRSAHGRCCWRCGRTIVAGPRLLAHDCHRRDCLRRDCRVGGRRGMAGAGRAAARGRGAAAVEACRRGRRGGAALGAAAGAAGSAAGRGGCGAARRCRRPATIAVIVIGPGPRPRRPKARSRPRRPKSAISSWSSPCSGWRSITLRIGPGSIYDGLAYGPARILYGNCHVRFYHPPGPARRCRPDPGSAAGNWRLMRNCCPFTLTEADIAFDFFGLRPLIECELAFEGDEPVGLVTYYWTYASFRAGAAALSWKTCSCGRPFAGAAMARRCSASGARRAWRRARPAGMAGAGLEHAGHRILSKPRARSRMRTGTPIGWKAKR